MDLEGGEGYFESFRDHRNIKARAEAHGKLIFMANKAFSYAAQKKVFYAKEKRRMQREACGKKSDAEAQNDTEEINSYSSNNNIKEQRAAERKRVCNHGNDRSPYSRAKKQDTSALFNSQMKNGFYKAAK